MLVVCLATLTWVLSLLLNPFVHVCMCIRNRGKQENRQREGERHRGRNRESSGVDTEREQGRGGWKMYNVMKILHLLKKLNVNVSKCTYIHKHKSLNMFLTNTIIPNLVYCVK